MQYYLRISGFNTRRHGSKNLQLVRQELARGLNQRYTAKERTMRIDAPSESSESKLMPKRETMAIEKSETDKNNFHQGRSVLCH